MSAISAAVSGQDLAPQSSKAAARPAGAGQWQQPEPVGKLLKGPALFGGLFILLFFGLFGAWAALAPLSSGAIAPGQVNPDLRRPIRHEVGGTIASMNVVEGQMVTKGQLLLTLVPVQAQAALAQREERWKRLIIQRARLDAQSAGAETITLPPDVVVEPGSELDAFLQNEQVQLTLGLLKLEGDDGINALQIAQLQSRLTGLQAEQSSLISEKALVDEELADKTALLAEQLIPRSVHQAVLREQVRLEGAINSSVAEMEEIGKLIAEKQATLQRLREATQNEVAKLSTEVNNQIAALEEELGASRDILDRTEVVSPADGKVIGLVFPAPGVVVGPRETIMEIVPADEVLEVIAHVSPRDIDVVHEGLQARLSLVPFANRNALPLTGTVTQIAADATRDERTQQTYYQVRISVAPEELARHDVYLAPGMPADVTIITGERTMLQYLIAPFLKSLQNAFIYD